MKYNQIPAKFPIPWAASAGGGFINPIPVPSQISVNPGRASLTDGFPPLNFQPVGAGGVPPFGQDMNGILNLITRWLQWQNAGAPVRFDADFATAIGGYPLGAMLAGDTSGTIWLNLADDNDNDPDAGGANWINLGTQSASVSIGDDTGSANVLTANVSPAPTAYLNGAVYIIKKVGTANNGAMTGNINVLGSRPIKGPGGQDLTQGQWPANYTGICVYNDALSVIILLNPAPAADPAAVQPGTIEFYSGVTPPTGRIKANGATLSRSVYANLWSFAQVSGNLAASEGLKTVGQYGPGDGSTTFSIPDLRGYFLRGFDDTAGVDPGRTFGSLQADGLKAHTHLNGIADNNGSGSNTPIVYGPTTTDMPGQAQKAVVTNIGGPPTYQGLTSSTGGQETRPKNIALLACIKY